MSTGIQWTDETWNPVVGCRKVSEGCRNCYAKQLHDQRHKAFLAGKKVASQYAHPFETVQLKPDRLTKPLSWQKPKRVFVNSVSDVFHEDVPDEYIDRMFAIMALASRHAFQVLTKRPVRMLAYTKALGTPAGFARLEAAARTFGYTLTFEGIPLVAWPIPSVWLGVSVENQAAADERIPLLLQTPAAIRFLSCEPLLGSIDLRAVSGEWPWHCLSQGIDFDKKSPRIDWVIAGGESGSKARPNDIAWFRSLLRECRAANVPFFMKQLGAEPGVNQADADAQGGVSFHHYDKKAQLYIKKLHDSHGGAPEEWPDELRVRSFPKVSA